MFSVPTNTKVYLARQAVDMRKGFPGLIAMTETVLKQDPVSGHLFVFINRRRDRMKVLFWGGSGFWIGYHLLESGRFQLPTTSPDDKSIELTRSQLAMILDGIDLSFVRQRKRFQLPSSEGPEATVETTVA